MAQSIEEQLEIMKAYADGKPVYMREEYRELGKKVEDKGHQFDFKHAFYSLKPIDWCTGKEASDAYALFMRNGSEDDEAPTQYNVTSSTKDDYTNKVREYSRSALNVVDTYPIFIAGAEWVLRNEGKGIDYKKSLQELREYYKKKQAQQDFDCRTALYGH